jgi:serine/threonine-protein kinase RsbW
MCAEKAIHLEIVVPTETRYLSLIGAIAEAVARAVEDYSGDREALAYHLNLVLTEAITNAIEHTVPADTSRRVKVCLRIDEHELHIYVHDQGQGFDLDAVPPPDFEVPDEHGRGIFLIRALMDGVTYRRTESGNVLEMHKKLA